MMTAACLPGLLQPCSSSSQGQGLVWFRGSAAAVLHCAAATPAARKAGLVVPDPPHGCIAVVCYVMEVWQWLWHAVAAASGVCALDLLLGLAAAGCG